MREKDGEEKRTQKLEWWVVGVVLIDLLLKWVRRGSGEYVVNTGIAWGWLEGRGGEWLSGAILLVIIVGAFWWKGRGERWLLWGGVGNLIDRLVWGGVTDYLRLPGVGLWFNGADLLICLGVAEIVINWFKTDARGAKDSI